MLTEGPSYNKTGEHFSKKLLNFFPKWELSSQKLNFLTTLVFLLTFFSFSFPFVLKLYHAHVKKIIYRIPIFTYVCQIFIFCFIGYYSVITKDGATLLACLVSVIVITLLFLVSRLITR